MFQLCGWICHHFRQHWQLADVAMKSFNAYLTNGTGRLWSFWSFILLQLCLVSASCVYNVWRFSYCWNGNAQVSACVAAVNACWFKKKSIWWAQASARFKRPSPFLARAKPEVKPMMVEQLAWMPQPVAWLHVYPTKVQTERYWRLFIHEHVAQGLEVALSSVLCAFFQSVQRHGIIQTPEGRGADEVFGRHVLSGPLKVKLKSKMHLTDSIEIYRDVYSERERERFLVICLHIHIIHTYIYIYTVKYIYIYIHYIGWTH